MKRLMFYRIISLITIFFVSTSMINNGYQYSVNENSIKELASNNRLLYGDVWGSIYHSEIKQCDSTPTVTANGYKINPIKASKQRWIAISQEMLNDKYRASLVKSNDNRFKGKIQYGDTVWIESPYSEINGWWVVCDAKNKRYTKSIDFLQTKGDGGLYDNDSQWSGKFINIEIHRYDNKQYANL